MPPEDGNNEDLAAVARSRQEWSARIQAGDVDAYLELLTPEAVWVPPGVDALNGREAFREWVEPYFRQNSYEFHPTPEQVQVDGEWALERGTYRSVILPRSGGKRMEHPGRYLLLWKKDPDGTWKIDRYVDVTKTGGESSGSRVR